MTLLFEGLPPRQGCNMALQAVATEVLRRRCFAEGCQLRTWRIAANIAKLPKWCASPHPEDWRTQREASRLTWINVPSLCFVSVSLLGGEAGGGPGSL